MPALMLELQSKCLNHDVEWITMISFLTFFIKQESISIKTE
jgi:hypothetical protein